VRPDTIDTISIEMTVDDRPALLLTLASDGGVRRMGSGDGPADGQAYEGLIGPAVFESLRDGVTEELLARAGRYSDSSGKGAPAMLTLTFRAGAEDTGLEFRYGSDSQGPPPPVTDLVRTAVAMTDDWYGQQVSGSPEPTP
jgi:hypothetical protein